MGTVTGAGGNAGSQGKWASRPTIADEEGLPMDKGGEEALKEMHRQANELPVEKLGNQMHELFTAMTLKAVITPVITVTLTVITSVTVITVIAFCRNYCFC